MSQPWLKGRFNLLLLFDWIPMSFPYLVLHNFDEKFFEYRQITVLSYYLGIKPFVTWNFLKNHWMLWLLFLFSCFLAQIWNFFIFKTIYVPNVFWAWSFHALNWWFNEQSFVILWVSWGKNDCFWKIFSFILTCFYLENFLEKKNSAQWLLKTKWLMIKSCLIMANFHKPLCF